MKNFMMTLMIAFGALQLVTASTSHAYFATEQQLWDKVKAKYQLMDSKKQVLAAKDRMISAKTVQINALQYRYGKEFGTRKAVATSIELNSARAEKKAAEADREALIAEIDAINAEILALRAEIAAMRAQ